MWKSPAYVEPRGAAGSSAEWRNAGTLVPPSYVRNFWPRSGQFEPACVLSTSIGTAPLSEVASSTVVAHMSRACSAPSMRSTLLSSASRHAA